MSQSRPEVVGAVYDAALNPESYQNIFQAWDRDVLDRLIADRQLSLSALVDPQTMTAHFNRALEMFETTKLVQRLKLQAFLDEQGYAAAIASMDGKILACNDRLQEKFALGPGQRLQSLNMDAQSAKNVSRAMARLQARPDEGQRGFCVHGLQRNGSSTVIVVEPLQDHGFLDCPESHVLLLKSCEAEWSEIAARVIADAFGYTQAELDVLELMCDGLSIERIAKKRKRKSPTIKNQIKSLMRKAEVHSQSELMRLVTGILHVTHSSPNERPRGFLPWRRQDVFQRIETLRLNNGRILQYAHYGRRGGRPVLFIQGNTAPLVPRFMVRALADEGIQVIAPFKPGAGKTSPYPDSYDPMLHFADCMQILDARNFKRLPLVGQCSGGIVCLKGAMQFAQRISSILLVDVGAPLQTEAQYRAMPPTARRTFLTAREMPDLLYMPHTLAAEAFFRDRKGEMEILNYAYGDSPRDRRSLENPAIYNAARDNIAYALSDPRQVVDDLLYWIRDWEPVLNAVARKMPVHFLHGDEHDWLPAADLQAFCEGRDNVTCQIATGAAQLFIYQQPKLFARAVRAMTGKPRRTPG